MVPFDCTTVHLAKMMDYESVGAVELKSPTHVEFDLLYDKQSVTEEDNAWINEILG